MLGSFVVLPRSTVRPEHAIEIGICGPLQEFVISPIPQAGTAPTPRNRMTTIAELFPGNMGRVRLTRVALRLRMPALLQMPGDQLIDAGLVTKLTVCLAEVQKG